MYKSTTEKVLSIFPHFKWHTTSQTKKATPRWEIQFMKKLSVALPAIKIDHSSTNMDPVSKTIYRKVWISLANNIYNKLEDDDVTTPIKYKILWLLDTAASGNYADASTKLQKSR